MVKMNHFLSTSVSIISMKKGKISNVLLEFYTVSLLYESFSTGIQSPRFLQVTLNFELE